MKQRTQEKQQVPCCHGNKLLLTFLDCATLLPPTDGNVLLAFSKSDQLLAIFTCDEAYAAVGETILSCVDGEWDKIPPLCACKQMLI